jgi:hypothetical protein
VTIDPTRKGRVLYTGELDMREILWALIAAPILYVVLWLLMAAF